VNYLSRLIEIEVNRDVADILALRCGASLDLKGLPDNVKSQLITNLKRGWASSISGRAYTMYQVLATVFDFPVFSVGRAERCVISYRTDQGDDFKLRMIDNLKIMWKLANPQEGAGHDDWRWRHSVYDQEGHRPEWRQVTCYRPQPLDIRALCHMMDVANIFAIVPKDNALRAIRSLETGETVDVTPWLRRKQ
jgi:hypothetical protein